MQLMNSRVGVVEEWLVRNRYPLHHIEHILFMELLDVMNVQRIP
ncbi:hypothetical protein FOCG_11461 [Fusarium oxysporum f. sp. radicis-lycopersici 26381]|uniref:Uncharacterized protein n=1 Tax=Fusarium oxysporum Fo47 TaxID=660027 RepID=W9KV46_FUSOX|nr:hypothetical protein FOZG_02743 [Fusarium oxysporum Fo47]EWZ84652.1 hypothetical protein FOWG_12405 [Fusarium oxysporum f. sp. lycopersici MN25]EXL47248.1 hypothetical protein FOCG_11461 [Fusarium oxysporum f. sp. radicis-lycopersici 26381]